MLYRGRHKETSNGSGEYKASRLDNNKRAVATTQRLVNGS